MALPIAASERQLKHRRHIDVQVFARDDGLWEVDAHLCDVRERASELHGVALPAGATIHDLLLRLVVDPHFNVLAAGAQSRTVPYPGACDAFAQAYEGLVGLNLMQGFRAAVRERLGGVLGCTHLSELTHVLPTAVVQAFGGAQGRSAELRATATATASASVGGLPATAQPFQIDRCRALRADGATVKTYYPRWYRTSSACLPSPTARDPS